MDPVVHFELPYEDAKRIAVFYEAAFGWQMQLLGQEMGNYVLATTALNDAKKGAQAGAINGGFFKKNPEMPAQFPSVVIAVASMRESIKKVTEAGGQVLGAPMPIPGVGFYVSFFDTEGNRCSMLEPVSGAA
jgi:predicted enzyme related to lactoylglutathione lyase